MRSAVSEAVWAGRARTLAFCFLAVLAVASTWVLVGAKPAHAADFRVNSTADAGDALPGNGQCATEILPEGVRGICTLRAAIEEANANDVSDTITFSSGMSGTITLALGQLTIANDISGPDLTIHGPGGSGLAVSGNNISRVFLINSAADVTIDGLTISSGRTGITGIGAGIYNGGTLRLSHSTVSGNSGGQAGGGIISSGTLTLENSTVSGNTNTDIGGGIFNDYGTLTLINSTVSGNTSDTDSGGIHNEGTMTLENSTVSANEAAGAGGGITNSGTAKLTNTIVARNTATTNPDVSGTLSFSSQGNNLIGDTSGSSGWSASDLLRQDPLLGPLQNNGGPTKTHALLPGSPAIDRAANSACLFTDQRGVQRKDGNGDGTVICDIGAFEAPTNTRPTITNPKPTPGSNTRDRTPSIAATVSDAQTNLAKTNIKLFVDGNRKSTFSYDRSTDRLSYTSGRLSFGGHTVKIIATDLVLTTTRSWRFKVVRG